MRLLDRQGDLFGTMTPLKGLTFLYEEIYCNRRQDPEVWCESMEWKDNPFLPAAEIERMTLALDESALQSRRYGRFSTGEGLVYPEFDEQVHVIDPFPVPVEWQDTLSIDPGLNNPLSAHWYAVDYDDNVYVVAEHFAAGKDIDYHAAELKRISKAINWHTDRQGRIQSLIDSAATQRTLASQKSVADLFYERGILVNVHVNKDLFAGIARVKSYLRQDNHLPNLYIFSSCTNLIRELKGYFWGKGDSPVKRDDHALDELRYYLMSRPANTPPVHQTEVQRDKERKARRLQWQGHAT